MKPEKQQIAIAEFRGWFDIERQERPLDPDQEMWRFLGRNKAIEDTMYRKHRLPDYLNDLNECSSLISHLEEIGYACVLVAEGGRRLCTFTKDRGVTETRVKADTFEIAICEAFLRTVERWVE